MSLHSFCFVGRVDSNLARGFELSIELSDLGALLKFDAVHLLFDAGKFSPAGSHFIRVIVFSTINLMNSPLMEE